MENNSSIDIIARGMAANAESGVSGLKASVSEILRSMADPYDPTHTYTSGQLVMYDGRLYRAISDITTPEPWTPEHWQSVDLEDEITRLREAVEAKYTKPTDGIPKTDLDSDVQESLSKADTALQEHQSLSAYRTAEAQDVIDAGKQDKTSVVSTLPDDGILANNTEYRLGTISALTVNGFGAGEAGFAENWAVVFTADTGIAVTLPASVKWSVATPVFEEGKTYYLSFVHVGTDYIAVWGVV